MGTVIGDALCEKRRLKNHKYDDRRILWSKLIDTVLREYRRVNDD